MWGDAGSGNCGILQGSFGFLLGFGTQHIIEAAPLSRASSAPSLWLYTPGISAVFASVKAQTASLGEAETQFCF